VKEQRKNNERINLISAIQHTRKLPSNVYA